MQAETILTETPHPTAVQFPPATDNLEATTREEEFEAWQAERVVFEEYHADKGVRS